MMLKPWVLAPVGLAAFAVLVWFAGPLLVMGGAAPLASTQARALVVAVFTLQYVAQKLWSTWRAARHNERVVSDLTPRSEPGLSAEALQLRDRFSTALAELRQMRFGARGGTWSSFSWKFGRSYLYQLPWYTIIGAPGAGKTTALLNSGLEFPLAAKLGRGAVRGVGGTRNCDWWFTDRAVLIDTAGRYTTHESDRVADRQAWEAFLGLLGRARPKRPLNGVLVAVSMGDLLSFTAEQRAGHARILRARLDELQNALRVRLPIYMLLTKCDLLPGFVDWFGAFSRQERDQVWGISFELNGAAAPDATAEFAPSFDRLADRLLDGLVERLEGERDSQRRARIFSLPRQLRALGEPLDALVRGAFGPPGNASSAAAICLRGVYLTSGTQQGTPIDRMLSAFGRELGLERQILPPNQSTGKSFFLSRLLSDVVFAEAELSGWTPRRQRWQRRLCLASAVLVVASALVLAARWVSGYSRSMNDISRLDADVSKVSSVVDAMPTRTGQDPRALLPALGATRALAQAAVAHKGPTELVAIGTGARLKLAAAAQGVYDRMLLGPLQRRIGKAVDATMRAGADMNVQYEALKAYAMLNDSQHFDSAGLKVFVVSYWDSTLSPPMSATERKELAGHLDALLSAGAVGSGVTLEPTLVESVRGRLSAQSPAERIALRLSVLLHSHPYADFSVTSLGPDVARLFVGADGTSQPRAVPGRFTMEAYQDVVIKAIPTVAAQLASEAGWVLGTSRVDAGAAGPQFMASYRGGYAQAWANLVQDLHLKPFASNAEAVQQAGALGAPNGPLARALDAIVRETSPNSMQGADGPIAPGDPFAAEFTALARFVTRDINGSSPLDRTLQSFRELQTLRASLASGAGPATTSATARDRISHVIADAQQEPEPVRSMLLSLAVLPMASVPGQGSRASGITLSQQVAARLGLMCLRSVAGRFPFNRGAGRDTSLEDFSRLFAPKGAFDEVFAQLLASRVDTSSDTWRSITPGGIDAMELERFRAAARLREVFFARGGAQPAFQLTFRPLDMDDGIDRFQLEVDGQIVRYAHGPPIATLVKWPGPHGSARIDAIPATEGEPEEYSGPWALFRLLDHAAVQEAGSPARFRVVFNVGGRHASFEVESDNGANPFRLRELERFECPISSH